MAWLKLCVRALSVSSLHSTPHPLLICLILFSRIWIAFQRVFPIDSGFVTPLDWLPVLTSALEDTTSDVIAFALVRLALAISTLIHEWSHLVAASAIVAFNRHRSRPASDSWGTEARHIAYQSSPPQDSSAAETAGSAGDHCGGCHNEVSASARPRSHGAYVAGGRSPLWLPDAAPPRAGEWAIWSAKNMKGNVSTPDWLASLCLLTPLPRTFAPHVVVANCRPLDSFAEAAIIRHAGWIFSLLLAALAWAPVFLPSRSPAVAAALGSPQADGGGPWGEWMVHVALGATVCAVSSLASDALLSSPPSESAAPSPATPAAPRGAHQTVAPRPRDDGSCTAGRDAAREAGSGGGGGGGSHEWRFFCGNFGMIVANSGASLHTWGRGRAVDALGVLERMAGISSERGGQSGGVVTFVRSWRGDMLGVRVRAKPAKRQSLSHLLISKFHVALFINRLTDSLSYLLALLLRPFTLLIQALSPRPPHHAAVAAATAASSPSSPSASAAEAAEGVRGGDGESSGTPSVSLYLGHTRFATSSVPSVGETHPHQWTKERRQPVWRVERSSGGVRLTCSLRNVGVYITHNGDFDFWNLFGRDRTHSEIGRWLEVVLSGEQTAQCDSVMIAGLMDLLRSHAMWLPSFRLAFHQTVVMSYEEVLSPDPSHAVPCHHDLLPVAAAAERAMAHVAACIADAGRGNAAAPAPRVAGTALRAAVAGRETFLEEAILAALHARPLPRPPHPAPSGAADSVSVAVGESAHHHPDEVPLAEGEGEREGDRGKLPECLVGLSDALLRVLVRQAVANFLDNDLFWAAKKFLENAKGSFGMTVACTADPERVVVAARNQPLALGFAPHLHAVLFSSESHSLLTPLRATPHSAPAATPGEGDGKSGVGSGGAGGESAGRIAYRVDLNEAEGEVMEVVLGGDGGTGHMRGTGGQESGAGRSSGNGSGGGAEVAVVVGVGGEGGRGWANGGEAVNGWAGEREHGEKGADAGGESEGEGVCLQVPELSFVALKLHSIKRNRPITTAEFRESNRLIAVANNPFLSADATDSDAATGAAAGNGAEESAPAAAATRRAAPRPRDLVDADLRDIPRVLDVIRRDWQDASSLNRRTAAALAAMLQAKAQAAAAEERAGGEAVGGMSRKEIDVLVTGVETSLWVGEQFAADLQNCFPQLRVVAVSANKVIGVMGNARGAISTAGFTLSRLGAALPPRHAVVIAVSQSGQTFPTLHATRILSKHCPGRVFVCTGLLDCKMAAAVGLSLAAAAPPAVTNGGGDSEGAGEWCCRVFHTHAGWRSAEPATVSAVACHATLTELLLLAARTLRATADATAAQMKHAARNTAAGGAAQAGGGGEGAGAGASAGAGAGGTGEGTGGVPGWVRRPLGMRVSGSDVRDLERMRDAVVEKSAPDIVGWSVKGHRVNSPVNKALRNQGLLWAMHVLETPVAWAISSLYIFIAVILGVPVFSSIAKAIPTSSTTGADALLYIARALDALLFCFLPLLVALPLRLLTRRDLLSRLGKRTVVIADVPWVHQSLEVYLSKLFSLSYWVASVDVHGANPIDHLVHRFTHRVTRGTLLAFGRPDGRVCSQSRCESWVLMALLQARTIVSLGSGAEVITVGHNPYEALSVVRRHVVLASNRPKFLCEKLLGVTDLEPMKRMATREHMVATAEGKSPFEALDSQEQVVGMHLCDEGTVQRARRLGLSMLAHGMSDISAGEAEDPSNREWILSAMGGDVRRLLHSQAAVEDLCENRFLSLERLIAFQVLFHRMAAVVASLPPLRFNIAQSQSRLRIATTAAPVSAADLEREWMEGVADVTMHDFTLHHRTRPHHTPLLAHHHHHNQHHGHHSHSHHGGMSFHMRTPFFSSASGHQHQHNHSHHHQQHHQQHSHHGYTHRISETLHHLLPLHVSTTHPATATSNPPTPSAASASSHAQQHGSPHSRHGHPEQQRVGGSYHGGGSGGGTSHHGMSFLRSILPLKSPARSSHAHHESAAGAAGASGRGFRRSVSTGGSGRLVSEGHGGEQQEEVNGGNGSAAGDLTASKGLAEEASALLTAGAGPRGSRVSFDVDEREQQQQQGYGGGRRLSLDVSAGSSLRGGMAGGVTLATLYGGGGLGMGGSGGALGAAAGAGVVGGGVEGGARAVGVPAAPLPVVEEAVSQVLPRGKGEAGEGMVGVSEGTGGAGEGEEEGAWRARGGERKVKGGGEILRLLKEK